MNIRTKTLDKPRTSVDQLQVLRDRAHMAWGRWQTLDSYDLNKPEYRAKLKESFDQAMRDLFKATMETDVFLSGVNEGRR